MHSVTVVKPVCAYLLEMGCTKIIMGKLILKRRVPEMMAMENRRIIERTLKII